MMAELRTILQKIDEQDGVAWLTFNRPEKKNALSQRLMIEMIDALKELSDNDKIKCIVTTGSGDSYSSGLDLYDLRENWKRKRPWDQAGSTYEIVRLLRNMPQVTVAAVRGWCLGGGLALTNGHDLCIAAESAKFGMPEVIRGSYGAVATSTLFHSGIPFKKAFYIQLTGRNLTAEQAERVGLVSQGARQPQCGNTGERKDRRLYAKRHGLSHRAKNRRFGFAPYEILHQSIERC
jgi:enoyl-CoA hydratase/carnithine racemase